MDLRKMISRCCWENVHVMCDYYMCEKCHRPCATIFLTDNLMDKENDRRSPIDPSQETYY